MSERRRMDVETAFLNRWRIADYHISYVCGIYTINWVRVYANGVHSDPRSLDAGTLVGCFFRAIAHEAANDIEEPEHAQP